MPEEYRVRQICPFAPVTLHKWRTNYRGGWIFPAVLTDTKRAAACSQGALPGLTKKTQLIAPIFCPVTGMR